MNDKLMMPEAPAQQTKALVETASRREMAEVQGMIVLAKQFPRDQKAALDRILNACSRPTMAEVAVYEYARGGTPVTGPTIRVAEMLAQNWGNVQFGVRELEQRNGESTVEAFAWDMETNTRQSKVFQVPHLRHTKQGTTVLKDPRDIYEMVANQGARRLRACILGVIPGDVVEAAVEQCELTMKTKIDVTPETIKKLVESFAAYGVTKDQIEARIQRRIDSITAAQILSLRKIYNSLKDEMSKPEDWFTVAAAPSEPGDAPPAPGKSRLASKLKPAGQPPAADPAPTNPPPSSDEQQELIGRLNPFADGFPKMFARACGDVGVGADEWKTAPADAMRRLLDRCEELSAAR